MLGNTTHFAPSHIRVADSIEQRGLAMVNMPKDGYDRRTGFEVFGVFFQNHASPQWDLSLFFNNNFFLFELGFITKFGRDHSRGIKIDLLVDARHDAIGHQDLDDCHCAGIQ